MLSLLPLNKLIMLSHIEIEGNSNIDRWSIEKPDNDYFTDNDVIAAYLQGKEDQKSEQNQILFERVDENVKKAQNISANFFDSLKSNGLGVKKMLLRLVDIGHLEAIIFVEKTDFISPAFKEVYKETIKLKKTIKSKSFNLSLAFAPLTDNLNIELLHCDGFFMEYGK